MAKRQRVMMATRARIVPWTQRDLKTEPSLCLTLGQEEDVESEVEDFTEPPLSRVIFTVCDSSSSIRWPKLSVT